MPVSVPPGGIGAQGTIRHSPGTADLFEQLDAARPAWQADALCAEYGHADFFDETAAGVAVAKAICGRCAVMAECRAYGVEHETMMGGNGVWGGWSVEDRRQMVTSPAERAREVRVRAAMRRGDSCDACGRDGLRISPRGLCGTCDRAWARAGKPEGDAREAFVAAQRAASASAA